VSQYFCPPIDKRKSSISYFHPTIITWITWNGLGRQQIGGSDPSGGRQAGATKAGIIQMSEASFDGRMIGMNGQVLTYPRWFFAIVINTQRRLNAIAKTKRKSALRVLERDKPTGFWRVLPEIRRQLGPLLELPNYNPYRRLACMDPGFHSGRPKHCGRRGLIDLLESGIDDTRLESARCQADLDDARISRELTNQIIQDVQATRKRMQP
jgi:hypothetical protein